MNLQVSPGQDAVYTALRAFVLAVVPAGTEVVQGLDNRVPMPVGPFVNVQAVLQRQLATNIETSDDPFPLPGGTTALQQNTQFDVQLDSYGPDSGNWAKAFSTLLRSDYGCAALAPNCQPLYADEARLAPLVDGEEQYQRRWIVTAALQWNPVTTLPQEFADTLNVDIINVDARYPP